MLEVGKKYLVNVNGWIMCKGVEQGTYRIEIEQYKNEKVARFYKPKGRKCLARHYVRSIMIDEFFQNLHGTQIIRRLENV